MWQISLGGLFLCVCCRLLYSVDDSRPSVRLPEVSFCLFGQLANYVASCTATALGKCLMGKMAICSDSLSNLPCQSIYGCEKPQLISLPLIESSAYGKTDPQITLRFKILPEKQVVGSISFTGDSPATGISFIKTSLIPELYYLFINRAFVIIILFPLRMMMLQLIC